MTPLVDFASAAPRGLRPQRRRLQQSARPTLKELLLADAPPAEIDLPDRGRLRRRMPEAAG